MKKNEGPVYLEKLTPLPSLRNRIDTGFIAWGDELTTQRVIEGYEKGIFNWSDREEVSLWYSPEVRCIFEIDGFIVSHSLKHKLKKHTFTFTFDQHFKEIMQGCAWIRKEKEDGTWILNNVIETYTELHKMGIAHSLEVWSSGYLAGGLYGVAMGKAFFGESMFHIKTDASKAALYFLFNFLQEQGFHFVDAQNPTEHLDSLGAIEICRDDYLDMLDEALKHNTLKGNWDDIIRRSGKAPEFYGRSH